MMHKMSRNVFTLIITRDVQFDTSFIDIGVDTRVDACELHNFITVLIEDNSSYHSVFMSHLN